jgi:hypothetical protein
MSNRTIKIGANAQRHLVKHEGSNQEDYIEFSKRTARKVAISRCDQEICERLGIYTVAHLAHLPTEHPDNAFMDEQEFEQYLFENTKNPYEIARIWLKLKADADCYVSVESMLNLYLPPFPKEDFERWGDKNCLSDVSKSWFRKEAIHLDVKVEEFNTNPHIGLTITIQDCIDFVMKYKPNTYKNPLKVNQEELEDRFKELCGFSIKDYYAEHLIKSCEFCSVGILDTVPF